MRRWLAILAAGLGALALRVVLEGRAALAAGDDWMLRGQPAEAIASYETAARWYLPLAPHVDTAYARLRALTTDPATALPAWRAIRRAARATRGAFSPHAGDLAAADAAIAALLAKDPAAGSGAGTSATARAAWYRARLADDGRPSTPAALLAAAGILAWLGGAFSLARRGLDAAGRLARRPALASLAVIVLGLACWALGLYTA